MIQGLLCAVFAICAPLADPPPAPVSPAAIVPGQIVAPPALDRQVVAVATPEIAVSEGLPCDGDRCAAYLDRIADPPVWTICHGETRGVAAGDVRSRDECMASLAPRVAEYWRGVRGCLTDTTLHRRMSAHRGAAYTSLGYNIGIGALCGSTALRRLNAGDIRGGCLALTWYNRAGGRVILGLVNRRAREQADCERGL